MFQQIVDTYGIPMYKEVNPAVFACVTFPFLFGVMFSDLGHGTMYFLFGSFLCLFEKPLRARGMKDLLYARYILVLMGLFAAWNGFMYNEVFALPIQAVWGSCFEEEPRNYVGLTD